MDSRTRHSTESVARAIERVCADGAESSESAILVGDRAGLVEWANLAWSRITGFPLVETVDKPISHFLDVSGIELELVDFVGQRFIEGQSSTIEFPFETFEGREIRVHLEVEPIRNRSGDLDAFVATARILPDRTDDEPIAPTHDAAGLRGAMHHIDRDSSRAKPASVDGDPSISISRLVACACEADVASAEEKARIHFDLALAEDLPKTRLDSERFIELVEGLIRASRYALGDEQGYITVMTGTTRPGRGHISQAHAVVARPIALAQGPQLYVEIHDTGVALSASALERIRRGRADESPHEVELSGSVDRARALGVTLHLDSTPGCGNQALLLIPITA